MTSLCFLFLSVHAAHGLLMPCNKVPVRLPLLRDAFFQFLRCVHFKQQVHAFTSLLRGRILWSKWSPAQVLSYNPMVSILVPWSPHLQTFFRTLRIVMIGSSGKLMPHYHHWEAHDIHTYIYTHTRLFPASICVLKIWWLIPISSGRRDTYPCCYLR